MDFVLYIAAMVCEAFIDGWAQVSDGWAQMIDGWANAHSGPPLATPLLFYSRSSLTESHYLYLNCNSLYARDPILVLFHEMSIIMEFSGQEISQSIGKISNSSNKTI